MARVELKTNFSELERMIKTYTDPGLINQLNNIVSSDGVTALVSAAIADNFKKEGPGWEPLKAQTIRNSVSKKIAKKLAGMTDAEILRQEKESRIVGSDVDSNRQILRKTGLLFQTVTTAGYSGSSDGGKKAISDEKRKKPTSGTAVTGQNIRRVEGTNLIWGTNLIYAGVHNSGKPPIPKREFLVIREEWEKRLYEFAESEMNRIIALYFEGQT